MLIGLFIIQQKKYVDELKYPAFSLNELLHTRILILKFHEALRIMKSHFEEEREP